MSDLSGNPRKIISLAVSSDGCADWLYAACDDGSIWFLKSAESHWHRLPNIPEVPSKPDEEVFLTPIASIEALGLSHAVPEVEE